MATFIIFWSTFLATASFLLGSVLKASLAAVYGAIEAIAFSAKYIIAGVVLLVIGTILAFTIYEIICAPEDLKTMLLHLLETVVMCIAFIVVIFLLDLIFFGGLFTCLLTILWPIAVTLAFWALIVIDFLISCVEAIINWGIMVCDKILGKSLMVVEKKIRKC